MALKADIDKFNDLKVKIGKNLKAFRLEKFPKGQNRQKDIADKLGIPQHIVSSTERGETMSWNVMCAMLDLYQEFDRLNLSFDDINDEDIIQTSRKRHVGFGTTVAVSATQRFQDIIEAEPETEVFVTNRCARTLFSMGFPVRLDREQKKWFATSWENASDDLGRWEVNS